MSKLGKLNKNLILNLHYNLILFYRNLKNIRKNIQEDEDGTLRATDDLEYRSRKRKLLETQSNIRLSMVRVNFFLKCKILKKKIINENKAPYF